MKTKAAVLYEAGRPLPYASSCPLVIEDLHLDGPGNDEVLVELRAAGLCHSDLSVITGSRLWPLPLVLGHEAAGIVRETGPNVSDLQEGDPVVFGFLPSCGRCARCIAGNPSRCIPGRAANAAGTLLSGARRFRTTAGVTLHHHIGVSAFSQYTVASRHSVVKIDSTTPLDIAALFGCAVMTGVGAVMNTARVMPGQSVAVFGLGGVGLSAVMGASAAGATPIIGVDRVSAKLELARRAGATHTINASTHDALRTIRELTEEGVSWAFEAVGNTTVLEQAFAATQPGGGTIAIGLPHPSRTAAIPQCQLVAEERTLRGSYMGSCTLRRDVPRFLGMYHDGCLPVDLLKTRTISLEQINAAFDELDTAAAVRQIIAFDHCP